MPVLAPTPTVRALLRRVVDYAGLFPPAALSMEDAATRYAAHLRSRDAWMLGRFVVPVGRLDELADAAAPLSGPGSDVWRVSALTGADVAEAGPRIRAFNTAHRGRFVVDVVECRPMAPGTVARAVGALPGELRSFVELPLLDDPRPMLEEINAAGAWAKMRTGGVLPGTFPTARQVARLVVRAAEVGVPFKATAGLHHPLAGEYPLTYDAQSARANMFGFLNVFVAAVFAQRRIPETKMIELIEERTPGAITFGEDTVRWRDLSATAKQIASTRTSLGISFGSCSFEEPAEGLRAMRLL